MNLVEAVGRFTPQRNGGVDKCVLMSSLVLVRLVAGAKAKTATVILQVAEKASATMRGDESRKGSGTALARIELAGTLQ